MNDDTSELNALSAVEIRDRTVRGDLSPREVTSACLRRIGSVDDLVRSFVTIDEPAAMAMAQESERRIAAGENLPLAGVPFALKDLTDTAGLRTTYGSRIGEHNVPSRDAAVARRLREAGGVLLGKTNTPEYGNRATTAYGLFPPTRNPWDLTKTPGGSSGGSAAAVAALLCPIAEGSDGGGSIRIPSSCCGVVGIKPSRGRVSNFPESNPRGGLTTHGPIARTVRDAALMLDVMSGPEPGDPFMAPPQAPSFFESAERDPGSLRIGLLVTSDKWIDPQVVSAVEKTASLLESLGHEVEAADVDLTGLGPLFRVMVEAESAAIEVEDPAAFSDPYSRWCYKRGMETTAVEYIRATEEMFRRSRDIVAASMKWDCLLAPTVTLLPQPLDTFLATTEEVADDDLAYIPFTYPFNISGQPALSLPLGWSDEGLPIGVQLIGHPFDEALIISVAATIERAAPWRQVYPAAMRNADAPAEIHPRETTGGAG
ncbi:MAG: amidase [Hyphomicrobiales bacterium]|nr:amidase [Hyphomicrobiales bacterium]